MLWAMANGQASIGVDIGGSKVLFDLLDDRFRVVKSCKMATCPEKGEKRFTREFRACLNDILRTARSRKLQLRCAGVGCAGIADTEAGILMESPNIPFIKDYDLAGKLSRWTGAPSLIGNDVQMGLYGEFKLGAARGKQSAIALFIGTGIGGAVVIDGKLHRGASGLAGEVGHFLVDAHGPLSGSERHGLLDDVASRTAIAAVAASYAAKNWAPNLLKLAGADVMAIKAGKLAIAVRKGDREIEELIRSRSRIVGVVMANLVNFLSPECVVMGGGLVDALGWIIVPEAEAAMRRYALPLVAERCRVVPSKLRDHAVAVGAARWAWDRVS